MEDIYNITNGDPTEFKNILDKLFTELGERANYRKMNINLMYFVASVINYFISYLEFIKNLWLLNILLQH